MSIKANKSHQMICEEIVSTVQNDNNVAVNIFDHLLKAVAGGDHGKPVHQNVVAIYLIDLIKFFTGVSYRKQEIIRNKNASHHKVGQPSQHWPYLLMREIEHGFELKQFSWGHTFNIPPHFKIKKTLTKILAAFNGVRGGPSKTIAITENALTAERMKLAFRYRINLDVVDLSDFKKIQITDLGGQLNALDDVIKDIVALTDFPFDAATASTIMRNHITANCVEGVPPKPSKADILIAGSGCAIENRLMSSMARFHGMRVINIFHGGSYGVQDKPTFNQGEKLMATDLAVFGQVKHFPGDTINFINGNYDNVAPLKPELVIKLPKMGDRLMYVPTSLRGENKRYGPYEDMADYQYVKLWAMMREIFGADLVFKLHPKNNDTAEIAPPFITDNFLECLDKADTFIFDYVSTAFTIAASTDKPIVYLDTGLQNFTKEGLKAIKSRCIYYDMRLELPNSFDDVINDATSRTFNQDYVEKFVSVRGQNTLDEALFVSLA